MDARPRYRYPPSKFLQALIRAGVTASCVDDYQKARAIYDATAHRIPIERPLHLPRTNREVRLFLRNFFILTAASQWPPGLAMWEIAKRLEDTASFIDAQTRNFHAQGFMGALKAMPKEEITSVSLMVLADSFGKLPRFAPQYLSIMKEALSKIARETYIALGSLLEGDHYPRTFDLILGHNSCKSQRSSNSR